MIESVPNKPNMVKVTCDGGCGRSVVLRRKKMVPNMSFHFCNSNKDGSECIQKLSVLTYGKVRWVVPNAASYFTGFADFYFDATDKYAMKQGLTGLNDLIVTKSENAINTALVNGKFLRKRDIKLEFYPETNHYIASANYNDTHFAFIMPVVD